MAKKSSRTQTWSRVSAALVALAVAALLTPLASGAKGTKATVIDRFGDRYELSAIKIKDRTELEYYVGDERRAVAFEEIQRIVIDGEAGEEERPVRVYLRRGRVEAGRMFTGGHGASPHQDSFGGARAPTGLTGNTNLGPFVRSLDDVKEVRFRHTTEAPPEAPELKAMLVTTEGSLFEVADLRVMEKRVLKYSRGKRSLSLDLSKVDRIQFNEYSIGQEQRPITITLWGGKQIHGMVEAAVARYSGETDRQYARRVGAAVTARTATGSVSLGMHEVKLIRFHPPESAEETGGGTKEGTSPAAPPANE